MLQQNKKSMEKTIWLTVEVAKQLIGKKIEWRAPMDEDNWDEEETPKFYGGKCIIRAVYLENNNRHPLECETISGDRLGYAILENEELTPVNGSDTRFSLSPAFGEKRTFTYSDLYREVEVIDIKDNDEEETEENNVVEVRFVADQTTAAKKLKKD